MRKSVTALVLIIALCFSLFSVLPCASAEATYTYGKLVYARINDSYCKIVGCLPDVGGSLYIPEKIGNMTVAEISENAFASMPIKTLAIDGKVVNGQGLYIRKGAFKNCPIEVLTVYNGVEKICKEAFSGCPIERMYLPKSLKYVEENAFTALSDNRKTEINFSGTESQWALVSVASPNPIFSNAEFNYSVGTGHEYNSPEATLLYTDGLYEPLTVNASDSADIAGYYIGTDDTYCKNEFITTADINGNVSETLIARMINYSLDGNEVSDMYKRYLIKGGTEITPAAPEINTSDAFKGWSENAEATEGMMSFVPEDGKTYYAIWDKVEPSDREIVLSHELNGEVLALTVKMKNAKGLKTGELAVDFDADALSFREVKSYDKYYGANCYKAYDTSFCIGFSVLYDSGLPSDDNELCTLYFDVIKRDGSKTDITVSGRWELEETKADTETITVPLIPREFNIKGVMSEDTYFVALSLEKGKYLTDGTLSLEYDSNVFTLTKTDLVSGWRVTAASPVNNKSAISFASPVGKQLTDEKYDICMFVFKINDRNAGEKTIRISGTGFLSAAKGDSVTVNLQYTPPVPEYTLGDVDNDGSITAADARLALRASVALEKLSDAGFLAADVNSDKSVTAGDARLILRASVGLEQL